MKILLTATHWAVASGRYAFDAFSRLGHDVHSAGPAMGARIWGLTVDERYIWTPTERPKGWQPELVIHMDGNLEPVCVGKMPHVVWGVDNHVRDYRFGGFEWDHLFLGHGHGQRMGEPTVTWLPCAYDPVWFTPGPTWTARQHDAALVGVLYGPRAELLYALRECMPDLSMIYGTGGVYEAYANAYQNAKISLVRSAAGDVAQRVWETAAMGCLVVMDECPDCEALGLVHYENCLIYRSTREAVDLARWALDHPKQAAKIAHNGQAWAQSGTWDARAQVIIDWYEARQKSAQKAAK